MDAVIAAAHNPHVTTWHRFARLAGIVLGGAGLLVAIWQTIEDPALDGMLGGLSWLAAGVAPLYGIGVWVACKRPEHPQARRLLLMGSSLAVNVALEGLIQEAADRYGAGSWLWWPNLLYQFTGVLGLIAGVLLIATYPDGVVERTWQRRVLGAIWLYLLVPPLLLLARPTLLFDTYLFNPGRFVRTPSRCRGWSSSPARSVAAHVSYPAGLVLIGVLFVRFARPTGRSGPGCGCW